MLEAIIVILAIAADQAAKHLVDLYLMPLGTTYPLIENVLHLTSAHNTGAVFGILPGWRWVFLPLTFCAAMAILFILIKKRKTLHLLLRVCLALILAGAIGNFIDRAALGYVRDMVELRFINFAIFNVADCCVTIGATLLICDLLFGKSKYLFDDKPAARPPEAAEADEKTETDGLAEPAKITETAGMAQTPGPAGARDDA